MSAATSSGLAIARAAYVQNTPWEQQSFFRLLTEVRIPAGGQMSYGKSIPSLCRG